MFIQKRSDWIARQVNITEYFPKIEPTDLHFKETAKAEHKVNETNSYELKFQSEEALEKTSDLIFEKETSIPDFEREPVYDVDNFEKNSIKAEKLLTPPPDFQDALKQLSQHLQEEFKRTLNADIVGIWPIKSNILLSKNTLSDAK